MINGDAVLAVIPARLGSKGIKRKNLAELRGASLIRLAAEAVNASEYVDSAVISTESNEIAAEARRSGLRVEFTRPASLATDEALSIDVWKHAWLRTAEIDKKQYSFSVLLEPSSPFRTAHDIDTTIEALIRTGSPSALTVSPLPAHHSPEKLLKLDPASTLSFYLKNEQEATIRQTLPDYYVRNGLCYAATYNHIVHGRSVVVEGSAAVLTDREVVNLDSEVDLTIANSLMASREANPNFFDISSNQEGEL